MGIVCVDDAFGNRYGVRSTFALDGLTCGEGTPGHIWANVGFLVSAATAGYHLYQAIKADPGYVPKPTNDSEVKMVGTSHSTLNRQPNNLKQALEELVDAGRLNGTNFCIMCMVGDYVFPLYLSADHGSRRRNHCDRNIAAFAEDV